MSNILIIKHGSLGDIAQASVVIQDIFENHRNENIYLLTTKPFINLFKKSPFIKSSFVLRTLGVVNLFINRAKTVTMKIIIKSTLFLTVITKQLCNGLLIMPRRLKKCNR